MAETAVRVEGLGKRYRIGAQQKPARSGWEGARSFLGAPFGYLGRISRPPSEEETLWALRDVSFEVKRGEVLGLIGPNGAGKSTLLRILSRITEPTEGRAEIHGRVGSLLEVGTGFHPELTGRENIYLNGAILGMKRAEIERKFDEIVDFSGVGRFIDTPVKRYSSGMYVRLAFAVAAHLEPEILLVDEVLAVGDAEFQRKCLGKMGDVAREGRTILFVSHNMPAIQRLCGTAHLLHQGRIAASGNARAVVDAYYRTTLDRDNRALERRDVPEGTVRFLSWRLAESSTGDPYACYTGEPCTISLQLAARRIMKKAYFGIILWAEDGTLVWAMRNLDCGGEYESLQEGLYEMRFVVPSFPLRPGAYQVHVSANGLGEGTIDEWYAQPKLQVLPRNESGLPSQWQGLLNISGEFRIRPMEGQMWGDDYDGRRIVEPD